VFRAAIDVGGTFTDIVAVDEAGKNLHVLKLRSTPAAPEQGLLAGVARLLSEHDLPASGLGSIVHVSTIGTNLFLGQLGIKIPKVSLITTKGFRDVIEIGRQNRAELYNVFFQRPKPLVPRRLRFGVTERVDSYGKTLQRTEREELRLLAKTLVDEDVESVAISFINSYLNSENEKNAKTVISEASNIPVFTSSEIDPEHREYERTSTTVVNATLAPVVSRYLQAVMRGLRESGVKENLHVLSSSGGLVDIEESMRKPIVAIESGPAAGVVGAAEIARLLGIDRVISLDMGGTTAKAGCVVDYRPLVMPEMEVGGRVHRGRTIKGSGYPVRYPCVDLAEVSAGGGTMVWADEVGTLRVGPISAGAEPGPACYGTGGTDATITDANLVLGRLGQKLLGGEVNLNIELAEEALNRVAEKTNMSAHEVAAAAVRLVNLQMARAVDIVSLERGLDIRRFALISFGGAGPMHAAEVAEQVGVNAVIVPPFPGLFSALGMLMSDMKYTYVKGMLHPLEEVSEAFVEESFRELTERAFAELRLRALDLTTASVTRTADLRYFGQGYELEVMASTPFDKKKASENFVARHEAVYGYAHESERLELTALRLIVVMPVRKPSLASSSPVVSNAEKALVGRRNHRRI
jgi:N-methylhydantoinase A